MSDTGRNAGGLTAAEIRELGTVFYTETSAHQLLAAAGLEIGKHPTWSTFGNSQAFWAEVARLFDNGTMANGRQRLLARALAEFPDNAVFIFGTSGLPGLSQEAALLFAFFDQIAANLELDAQQSVESVRTAFLTGRREQAIESLRRLIDGWHTSKSDFLGQVSPFDAQRVTTDLRSVVERSVRASRERMDELVVSIDRAVGRATREALSELHDRDLIAYEVKPSINLERIPTQKAINRLTQDLAEQASRRTALEICDLIDHAVGDVIAQAFREIVILPSDLNRTINGFLHGAAPVLGDFLAPAWREISPAAAASRIINLRASEFIDSTQIQRKLLSVTVSGLAGTSLFLIHLKYAYSLGNPVQAITLVPGVIMALRNGRTFAIFSRRMRVAVTLDSVNIALRKTIVDNETRRQIEEAVRFDAVSQFDIPIGRAHDALLRVQQLLDSKDTVALLQSRVPSIQEALDSAVRRLDRLARYFS